MWKPGVTVAKLNLKQALLRTAAAGALLLGIGLGSASAAPIGALLAGGDNLLSDNSAEYLVELGTPDGIVDVGERLRGIASIGTIENSSFPAGVSIGGATGHSELTAIFDITVLSKVTFGMALSGGGLCGRFYCFEFGPSIGFAAEMDAAGFGLHPGAMVGFFEDPTPDYTRSILTDTIPGGTTDTTPASIATDRLTMEGFATNGSAFWLFGLDFLDDFWVAGADTDSIAAGGAAPLNSDFGSFNLGVSLLEAVTGPTLLPISCLDRTAPPPPVGPPPTFATVDACGNGHLLSKGPTDGGPGGSTPHINSAMDSFDDVNFNIQLVPEPGTLGLFGIALLGFGWMARRRKAMA
jgi:hypothetical protein